MHKQHAMPVLHGVEEQAALVRLMVGRQVVKVKQTDLIHGVVGAAGKVRQAYDCKYL